MDYKEKSEKLYMCENDNLKENLQILIDNNYKYIVKCCDSFLGGWENNGYKKHIHLIACETVEEREKILADLRNDKFMKYIDWQPITAYNSIYAYTRGKTFTIRNDWTRAFE
jgi:hypothetical protein